MRPQMIVLVSVDTVPGPTPMPGETDEQLEARVDAHAQSRLDTANGALERVGFEPASPEQTAGAVVPFARALLQQQAGLQ